MRIPPPTHLCCEYLDNPLGVDVRRPRFSWILDHPQRSQVSTAFRILVSSTPELAALGSGDLWDSGKTESLDETAVVYDGVSLLSFQSVYWRVRWWDKEGTETAGLPTPPS